MRSTARFFELDAALGEPAQVDGEHRRDHRDLGHTMRLRREPYAPSVPTTLRLRPSSMAAGGSALARDDDGRVVFVDGALPDEPSRPRCSTSTRTIAHAIMVQVIEPAEGRVAPPCPYVGAGCGGCGWQHIAPQVQVELKRDIVLDALRRIGRLTSADVSAGWPLPSTGYRTTVRMGVHNGRATFRGHRSHDLVSIDECLVAHPLLHDLIARGRYEGATDVTLRCGSATGERLVLASPHGHGVQVPDDVIVIGANEVKRGRTARIHEVVGGRRFLISATSFFQARTDGAEALVDAVRHEFVDDDEAGTFVDAYCGVGLFAGLLGAGRKIVAVERHGPAVRDAPTTSGVTSRSCTPRSRRGTRFPPGSSWPIRPARASAAAAARLAATGATRLVLVSCDPASLARDVGILTGLGFVHRRSTLVDLFPHPPCRGCHEFRPGGLTNGLTKSVIQEPGRRRI